MMAIVGLLSKEEVAEMSNTAKIIICGIRIQEISRVFRERQAKEFVDKHL